VMLLPTMPDIAPLLAEPEEALNAYRNRAINLLCLSGLSGVPQVAMPLTQRNGAPLGLSLLGPRGSDVALVRLAARLAGERIGPA
jgi:amidase